jgi:hypothetical protein
MKKVAPVLAALEMGENITRSSILGSAGTRSLSSCVTLEAAARMADEDPRLQAPGGGWAVESYLTGEDETEHRPPWPRGPTDEERNEMIAMAVVDEARRRRQNSPTTQLVSCYT